VGNLKTLLFVEIIYTRIRRWTEEREGSAVGIILTGMQRIVRRNPVLVPLFPPHIPH